MDTMPPSAQGAAPDAEDLQDGGADEASEQDSGDSGYTILIHCDGEGKLTVGCETDGEETQEQPSEEAGDMPDMQPVKDIKEALTMALQIYKADGKSDGTAEHASQLQSQGFSAGYNED